MSIFTCNIAVTVFEAPGQARSRPAWSPAVRTVRPILGAGRSSQSVESFVGRAFEHAVFNYLKQTIATVLLAPGLAPGSDSYTTAGALRKPA